MNSLNLQQQDKEFWFYFTRRKKGKVADSNNLTIIAYNPLCLQSVFINISVYGKTLEFISIFMPTGENKAMKTVKFT